MKKIDFNREFTLLLRDHIQHLDLSSDSLFSLIKIIFDHYRFDIKFLYALMRFADKFKQLELDNEK